MGAVWGEHSSHLNKQHGWQLGACRLMEVCGLSQLDGQGKMLTTALAPDDISHHQATHCPTLRSPHALSILFFVCTRPGGSGVCLMWRWPTCLTLVLLLKQ